MKLDALPSPPRMRRAAHQRKLLTPLLATALLAGPLAAQGNIIQPVSYIEQRLGSDPFQVADIAQSRPLLQQDRTSRVLLSFEDGTEIAAKWKTVGPGAQGFNDEPRYDIAAYELQKLFLDEPDYVVPPSALRSLSLEEFALIDPTARPTLRGTQSVLIALQYWLFSVTNRDPWDPERFAADTAYARHFANMNILTHIIDHKDANLGNILISTLPESPRVFSVDNDIAFGSRDSDRGTEWRHLKVRMVPAQTVDRLRILTREDLERQLGVVAQFDIRDGHLVTAPLGANIQPGRGVRRNATTVQFGLTTREIREVHNRIQRLVAQVDAGRIETF